MQPILNFDVELMATFHCQGGIKGAFAIGPIVRVKTNRLAKAVMSLLVLPHTHENGALEVIPVTIPAVSTVELTQSALQITLFHKALCKMLGFFLGDLVKAYPALRYDLQRLFIGQVQLYQLVLRPLLLFFIQKLIRVAGLYLLTVSGAHGLRICARRKSQHMKGVRITQARHLPSSSGRLPIKATKSVRV